MEMNVKILVSGVAVLAIGVLFMIMPGVYGQLGTGVGLVAGPTQSLYLIKVAPGSYSYLEYNLTSNGQLTATIGAGPQSVDFFLMNAGNFSIWSKAPTASSQVYPESAFNVKNYTFGLSGSGSNQTYFLVFDSRSTTASTDVLVHASLQSVPDSTVSTVPAAFVGIGAVLALVGVRVGGKRAEVAETIEEAKAPALEPAAVTNEPACRFCGAKLRGSTKFCTSCGRSQG